MLSQYEPVIPFHNECIGIFLNHKNRIQKLVTKSSLIPLKPTRIGGRYFLYWEVTNPR
jgi:hypothetical protein